MSGIYLVSNYDGRKVAIGTDVAEAIEYLADKCDIDLIRAAANFAYTGESTYTKDDGNDGRVSKKAMAIAEAVDYDANLLYRARAVMTGNDYILRETVVVQ